MYKRQTQTSSLTVAGSNTGYSSSGSHVAGTSRTYTCPSRANASCGHPLQVAVSQVRSSILRLKSPCIIGCTGRSDVVRTLPAAEFPVAGWSGFARKGCMYDKGTRGTYQYTIITCIYDASRRGKEITLLLLRVLFMNLDRPWCTSTLDSCAITATTIATTVRCCCLLYTSPSPRD